ncbi:hypothetical protein EWM64_g1281 [Hericium alpestre]|uniref:Uncharacterized protein n=1 Tax=Hericium alpestre TaxID=135208 RepID=A0A4Z0A899_9AGAM|nr:hypothetical protein EWM64_g1281 [Hericium alpestre]
MVDWNSPAELVHDADAFAKFIHALLGLYIWEWFTSLDFEWSFVSGKRSFRWPLIFYFVGRYSLLFALVGIAITLNVQVEVNCQALYTFNQCLGNFAIGLACVNLSIRAIAVWSSKLYIVIPLVAIMLGHWALLLHGILLKAAWVPGQGCVITATNNTILSATFIYSMCLDFLVMALAAYKLAYKKGSQSRLVQMIFGDGLIYFFIAFCANLTATIFMTLDLNPVMSIIANVPAATTSTIVACRVVRRLTNYTTPAAEMFNSTQNSYSRRAPPNVSVVKTTATQNVHVQMNTFAVTESGNEYETSPNKEFDPESQTIPDLKRESL